MSGTYDFLYLPIDFQFVQQVAVYAELLCICTETCMGSHGNCLEAPRFVSLYGGDYKGRRRFFHTSVEQFISIIRQANSTNSNISSKRLKKLLIEEVMVCQEDYFRVYILFRLTST